MRIAALMVLLAAAVPSAAQTPGDAARLDRENRFDTFFTCLAPRPGAAAFALDATYDGGFTRRHAGLAGDFARCANAARVDIVRINPFLMRGGIARAAWLAGTPAPSAYAPPPVSTAAPSGPDARLAGSRQSEAVAAAFSACLLGKNRAAAEAFTRAQSGSAAERQAFTELASPAEACTVDAPDAGPMSGDRLRAALALVLWAGPRA